MPAVSALDLEHAKETPHAHHWSHAASPICKLASALYLVNNKACLAYVFLDENDAILCEALSAPLKKADGIICMHFMRVAEAELVACMEQHGHASLPSVR